jgi:FKBP-type peptidyl-prolyl cis-trans isomerase
MKRISIIILTFFITGMNITVKSQEMTEDQSLNYALGAYVGGIMKEAGVAMDQDFVLQGFKEAHSGKNKFDQMQMQEMFEILNQKLQAQQLKGADAEKQKGEVFLAENKKKEGVIETASGLQYKVIKMGNGEKPLATDRVKVHYHGTTIDGVVFDSSVERGEPIVFGLNQVIKGWTEGVQLMPVGSKFIFYIPSDLAYGDRGAGGAIKPGAALIFEVELFEINPQQ